MHVLSFIKSILETIDLSAATEHIQPVYKHTFLAHLPWVWIHFIFIKFRICNHYETQHFLPLEIGNVLLVLNIHRSCVIYNVQHSWYIVFKISKSFHIKNGNFNIPVQTTKKVKEIIHSHPLQIQTLGTQRERIPLALLTIPRPSRLQLNTAGGTHVVTVGARMNRSNIWGLRKKHVITTPHLFLKDKTVLRKIGPQRRSLGTNNKERMNSETL